MQASLSGFPHGVTVLVTGGAGFIGSNLCHSLVGMDCKVRCLDDFSTGRKANLMGLYDDTRFSLIEGDIRDMKTCMEATQGVDYVLHQAAWGSVPRSMEMPVTYEMINIGGTVNMMEAARLNDVRKFVYASSSSVYGDESSLPKVECRIGMPLSPYALTKRVNEEYGHLYYRTYGLDTYGLRYFNVFGRRQDPQGAYAAVIPRFVLALSNGECPLINGDGEQSRDFTYIDNVVCANLLACLAPSSAAGCAYNIACGARTTLNELYKTISGLLGVHVQPKFGPARPGDVRHSHADISLAKTALGYEPSMMFKDGIRETISWYQGCQNES
ncbi:UDP-glucose 4-epimerase [Actinomyces bovis]|uniref:UDP-glucose 4-epimerase n=2 Tax=Actinomyces bovis TaxID=1658 RepID=A0ABY1VPB6_9ACTO|nr:UDP-glucose 4-epimerase [Actinomyces bovis]VEG53080.1 UDP-glucose 4-epimerase [Actinomyces israelii]